MVIVGHYKTYYEHRREDYYYYYYTTYSIYFVFRNDKLTSFWPKVLLYYYHRHYYCYCYYFMVSNVCITHTHNIKMNTYITVLQLLHIVNAHIHWNTRIIVNDFYKRYKIPHLPTTKHTHCARTPAVIKCSTFITVCPSKITSNKLTWFDCTLITFLDSKPQSNFSSTDRILCVFDEGKKGRKFVHRVNDKMIKFSWIKNTYHLSWMFIKNRKQTLHTTLSATIFSNQIQTENYFNPFESNGY